MSHSYLSVIFPDAKQEETRKVWEAQILGREGQKVRPDDIISPLISSQHQNYINTHVAMVSKPQQHYNLNRCKNSSAFQQQTRREPTDVSNIRLAEFVCFSQRHLDEKYIQGDARRSGFYTSLGSSRLTA